MQSARRYTSMSLGQYPKVMVRVICSKCGRKGQNRKETLIAEHGADVTMPDLLHLIAKCSRHGKFGDGCGVRYGDLLPRGRA
ncbi:MAG TPA: hypothetical protein VK522_22485 [Pseudolabrys sp.]|nr:hypothetical protein [Pseudolabrys sp.]